MPTLVITGTPIAKDSPNLTGEEARFEYAGSMN